MMKLRKEKISKKEKMSMGVQYSMGRKRDKNLLYLHNMGKTKRQYKLIENIYLFLSV